jgi:c-di-GMP-binding flagellar brake protein YcgR
MLFFPFKFQFFVQAQGYRGDSITKYDHFAEVMRDSINRDFSTGFIAMLVTIVVLLVLGIVFYEIYRSTKTKKDLMALAWARFNNFAAEINLKGNEIALLKDIVQVSGLQDPDSIIKSPNTFETSLNKYYVFKKIESMPKERLSEIRSLRKSLGFLPLSKDVAYVSTKQFDSGEKCIVQIPEDGRSVTHKGMCVALSIKEEHWIMSRPDGPPIPGNTKMLVSLTRPGDAEYVFSVQVLADLGDELVLSHTTKLNRAQQRNWVRVDVSLPVEVTKMEGKSIGDIFSGRIIDMSGGGFGIVIPARLHNDSKLLLNFDLPGQGPVNDLPVKVVRVAGAFGKDPSRIIHSVAFESDLPLIQEQIIHYVFEKQRQEALIKRR